MAYSKQVKNRATELANSCSSAANVLKALEKEFPADQIPVDERTIRRWFQGHNVRYLKSKAEHDSLMSDIAEMLLNGDVGKVIVTNEPEQFSFVVDNPDSDTYELTRGKLTGIIEGNIGSVVQKFSSWHMFDCFTEHLMAEFLPDQDYYEILNRYPGRLVNTLRKLAERKTFKGTCPVCESL